MKSRIERWEKYRARILTSPDWTFSLKKRRVSSHLVDDKAMSGKSLGSKAIALNSENRAPRMLGYESYKQAQQTLKILKYTLFVVAIILMIVLYVMWVR